MKKLITGLFILPLLFGSAIAATIYTDNGSSGCSSPSDNDYNPSTRACGSGSATVFTTINGGIGGLSGGDTLIIKAGTYNERPNTVPPSGTSGAPTTIEGEGITQTIVRPTASGHIWQICPASGQTRSHITVRNLKIDGSANGTGTGAGIIACEGRVGHWIVEDLWLTDNGTSETGRVAIYSLGTGLTSDLGDHIYQRNLVEGWSSGTYYQVPRGVIQDNEFTGMQSNGILVQNNSVNWGTAGRSIVRRNIVRNNTLGPDTGDRAISIVETSDVHDNIVFGNTDSCIRILGSASNSRVWNNLCYLNGGGIILASTITGAVAKNNISDDGVTDENGGNTLSNNLTSFTASSLWIDPPTSGTDSSYNFGLLSGASNAIDQGTTSIASGLTRAFNGSAPDIGPMERFTASNAEIGNVADNKVVLNLAMSLNTPVQITNSTGWTTTCGTISSVAETGDAQLTFTLSGDYGGGGNCAISYTETTGNATDSLLVGNSLNQRMSGLSSFAVADNTGGGGGGSHVFTQSHFRFHSIRGTEASPLLIAAEDTNVTLPRGAAFRLRTKLTCTSADCPAINLKLRYAKNGGSYTEIPSTAGADQIEMYGTGDSSTDIPNEGTATTELLTNDQPTNVAAIIVRTNSAIPNWDCSASCEGEFEHIIKITTSASTGDTYDFRLYNQDGTALNTYTQTPRLTVGEYVAGSGY